MSEQTQNRVAIVTGASQGIGACLAEGLASDGYSLVLVARSKDKLEQIANRIKSITSSVTVETYSLDIKDYDGIKRMVAFVQSKFGRIDLLINNAGLGSTGTLSVPLEHFDEILSVNLKGPFAMLQSVVPIMETQGNGTIINISSRSGKVGFEDTGAYAASKFGLGGLGESLYRELSPRGIKVATICPSWVDTEMSKHSAVPNEEKLPSEDILKTVRWILSLSPVAVVRDVVIECNKHIF